MKEFLSDVAENLVVEFIVVLLFSGLITMLINKIRQKITEKNSGIYRIHKRGFNVNNFQDAIRKSRKIKQIAFMPLFFIREHQSLLTERYKDGSTIQFLFCSPESPLLKELSSMERGNEHDVPNDLSQVVNLLVKIADDAGMDSRGSIEVRLYSAEIRNPATICEIDSTHRRAYLTISVPPKKSTEMPLIEYRDENCRTVDDYFNLVWKRHESDVCLKVDRGNIIVNQIGKLASMNQMR